MSYVGRNKTEASNAAKLAATFKEDIQITKDHHLANMDTFDPALNTAYTKVTNSSICAYASALNATGTLKLMYLNNTYCNSLNKGWGKEVILVNVTQEAETTNRVCIRI